MGHSCPRMPAVPCLPLAATTRSTLSLPPLLSVQGKPARWEAFPRAVALDYARRGGGQALTDGELSAAAGLLGSRLQQLDLGGAFQLTAEGVHGALRACTALRSLAADGSTLQDAAFSGLAPPSGGGSGDSEGADHTAAASGSSGSVSSGSKGPSAMVVCGDGDGCGSPTAWTLRSHPAPPLHRLEQLSLRGCMFLRGGLLADLAACPHLSSLDLAGCSLALK